MSVPPARAAAPRSAPTCLPASPPPQLSPALAQAVQQYRRPQSERYLETDIKSRAERESLRAEQLASDSIDPALAQQAGAQFDTMMGQYAAEARGVLEYLFLAAQDVCMYQKDRRDSTAYAPRLMAHTPPPILFNAYLALYTTRGQVFLRLARHEQQLRHPAAPTPTADTFCPEFTDGCKTQVVYNKMGELTTEKGRVALVDTRLVAAEYGIAGPTISPNNPHAPDLVLKRSHDDLPRFRSSSDVGYAGQAISADGGGGRIKGHTGSASLQPHPITGLVARATIAFRGDPGTDRFADEEGLTVKEIKRADALAFPTASEPLFWAVNIVPRWAPRGLVDLAEQAEFVSGRFWASPQALDYFKARNVPFPLPHSGGYLSVNVASAFSGWQRKAEDDEEVVERILSFFTGRGLRVASRPVLDSFRLPAIFPLSSIKPIMTLKAGTLASMSLKQRNILVQAQRTTSGWTVAFKYELPVEEAESGSAAAAGPSAAVQEVPVVAWDPPFFNPILDLPRILVFLAKTMLDCDELKMKGADPKTLNLSSQDLKWARTTYDDSLKVGSGGELASTTTDRAATAQGYVLLHWLNPTMGSVIIGRQALSGQRHCERISISLKPSFFPLATRIDKPSLIQSYGDVLQLHKLGKDSWTIRSPLVPAFDVPVNKVNVPALAKGKRLQVAFDDYETWLKVSGGITRGEATAAAAASSSAPSGPSGSGPGGGGGSGGAGASGSGSSKARSGSGGGGGTAKKAKR